MSIFDSLVNQNLVESVVSMPKENFDKSIFNFNEVGLPVLRESVRIQILKGADEIQMIIPVVEFFIIGSSITKQYSEDGDIDVTVQVDAQLIDSIATADIMYTVKKLNGHLAADTRHPINYYIITHEYDQDKTDAIYDVANDRWIKSPDEYDPELEKWTMRFHDTLQSIDIATGEIRRDLIDMEEIKELDTRDAKKFKVLLTQKLSHIEELLKHITSTYKDAYKLKNMAFDRFMTPQELQEYGSRNRLPENILYKLLEKYYFVKMIKKIETILDERDELDLTDASRVQKAMSDTWKIS